MPPLRKRVYRSGELEQEIREEVEFQFPPPYLTPEFMLSGRTSTTADPRSYSPTSIRIGRGRKEGKRTSLKHAPRPSNRLFSLRSDGIEVETPGRMKIKSGELEQNISDENVEAEHPAFLTPERMLQKVTGTFADPRSWDNPSIRVGKGRKDKKKEKGVFHAVSAHYKSQTKGTLKGAQRSRKMFLTALASKKFMQEFWKPRGK